MGSRWCIGYSTMQPCSVHRVSKCPSTESLDTTYPALYTFKHILQFQIVRYRLLWVLTRNLPVQVQATPFMWTSMRRPTMELPSLQVVCVSVRVCVCDYMVLLLILLFSFCLRCSCYCRLTSPACALELKKTVSPESPKPQAHHL